jgi:hypothetical protein
MKISEINMGENLWKNPNIRVVWEDYPENITQDKIKDVRQYFAKSMEHQVLMLSQRLDMRIRLCNPLMFHPILWM